MKVIGTLTETVLGLAFLVGAPYRFGVTLSRQLAISRVKD